ncbi:MAG: class I SAM-dependent methyltransferase [Pseudomonadota bacterium]
MSAVESYVHFAKQLARTGWYYGLRRITEHQVSRFEASPVKVRITKNAPTARQLLQDVFRFLKDDAALVRQGLLPSIDNEYDSVFLQLRRIKEMLDDLPDAHHRRVAKDGKDIAEDMSIGEQSLSNLPDYYVQNFHYQTGGYLTEQSARLYDLQVETLFLGTSGTMRRQVLKPITEYVQGKAQRNLHMLDVACGTGRFLAQVRQAFPCMPILGIDLSAAYIKEASRYLSRWRNIDLEVGNAERLAVPDDSQDIVTCIYLFHELPPQVRRTVVQEMHRVLKPGGLLVFMDSLQYGDNPDYDGLLEAFPQRFHEPYYRNYLIDDLKGILEVHNLYVQSIHNALLSKVITCLKGTV